jgi:UDP-N-acetylmuramoylalanine--D-glutamate ligase
MKGKKVLIVGAGKSGVATARFCQKRGASVTLSDRDTALAPSLDGVRWELGPHRRDSFLAADLIVLSPGVPPLAELDEARSRGVEVTGEIELASRHIRAPIVAVTGTNGKSTVTALAGCIAQQSRRPVFVGGNLGTPLITAVDSEAAGPDGIVVVELSSFQLETCETFHPRAAALLNLTPDHLDRYGSVEEYGRAKLRIARRMTRDDVLVVNARDAFFAQHTKSLPTRICQYGTDGSDGSVVGKDLALGKERYPMSALQLVGKHNVDNALAALLLVRRSGLVSEAQALAGLSAFRALPHRMQLVAEHQGVRFYDDSKATNVDSVVAGVDGFPSPFALIAGGRDKGGSYQPLVEVLQKGRCRGVVLIGEAAEKIEHAIGEKVPCQRAASMDEAVRAARKWVGAGEAVVLSPACSSFDMFRNYAHRGEMFAKAVEALG